MENWDFAGAVRRWRERVAPDAVGLPAGGRRRAPGLRREELAGLVGISVDYLTRLEQGRATSPSVQVVEALARGLRLSDGERELLFQLSGQPAPGSNVVSARITPSVQRILDRLSNTPVAVYDAAWTLVTANAPYNALMGETTAWRGIERNAVWRNLVGPGNRAVHTPDEKADLETQLVADLRLTAARYPADRRTRQLVSELSAQSPRFVELWSADAPAPRPGRHKVIDHPSVGRIALDCDTLVVAEDDLRLMVYSAEPGTDDAESLSLAIVLGTQQLVE
ncbi:helix-turn-helix transcriptional regulator [Paramicrobacterium fandaimingii]|uniref:helix-turn-helix transcriptional regulator n=1 Tax=Paramicrobacterium fandaimingii TaxID=2708079 RepID=UPI001423D361|nr:helix-turn-helix transcriptional regulator [Microbacterium fandaimingii]